MAARVPVLVVTGVTARVPRTEKLGQARPRPDAERMRDCPGRSRRRAVAVQVLYEPAAHEDVDGLETTADAEDGDASAAGPAPRGHVQRIARRIDHRGTCGLLTVERGVEIRPAREEQTVHRREGEVALGRRRRRVERNGIAARSQDRLQVHPVLLTLQLGFGRSRRVGQRDRDSRGPRHIAPPVVGTAPTDGAGRRRRGSGRGRRRRSCGLCPPPSPG